MNLSINYIDSIKQIWRTANYISAILIHLKNNVLLRQPLQGKDIKKQIDGHWGSCTGINAIYVAIIAAFQNEKPPYFLIGTGHAGPSLLACSFLEGTLPRYYSNITYDESGLLELCKNYGVANGFSAEITASYPGACFAGGELGNALAIAQGMSLGASGELFIVILGDGELETSSTQAALSQFRFLRSQYDGVVIPIINANNYRMTSATNFSTLTTIEINAYFNSLGYTVMECNSIANLVEAFHNIKKNKNCYTNCPLIVYRNLKGESGPFSLNGKPFAGTVNAHKVPKYNPHINENIRTELAQWLSSYHPEELFEQDGSPSRKIVSLFNPNPDFRLLYRTQEFLGSLKGRRLKKNEKLLDELSKVVIIDPSPAKAAAHACINFLSESKEQLFFLCPDEIYSNQFDELHDALCVFDSISGFHQIESPTRLSQSSICILNENLCFAWQCGLSLAGKNTILVTYEAFAHIFGSQLEQMLIFLTEYFKLPWSHRLPSINIVLTSIGWKNVPSHHNMEFIDSIASRNLLNVNIYFPYGQKSAYGCMQNMLKSSGKINFMVIDKKHNTLSKANSKILFKPYQILASISPENEQVEQQKNVVLVAIGDLMGNECLKASDILVAHDKSLNISVVAIIDFKVIMGQNCYTKGDEFSYVSFWNIVKSGSAVIFVYTGNARVIEGLLWKKVINKNIAVLGFNEQRTSSGGTSRMKANHVHSTKIFEKVFNLLFNIN